jgi:hypothetical protein
MSSLLWFVYIILNEDIRNRNRSGDELQNLENNQHELRGTLHQEVFALTLTSKIPLIRKRRCTGLVCGLTLGCQGSSFQSYWPQGTHLQRNQHHQR